MIKIGILGCAEIAFRRFLPALMENKEFECVCIAEEYDKSKLEQFEKEFGIKSAESFQSIIEDENIDAVYIPLPPALHFPYAKAALEHGKHVFVEKPSTISYEQTSELVELARKKNLVLQENYMFQYHAQLADIEKIIASGELGKLRLVRTSFGFPRRAGGDFRYVKELGGGTMLDNGGYTIKLINRLLGRSTRLVASRLDYDEETGVDIFGTAEFMNADGVLAQAAFGMDCQYQCSLELWGSKGRLTTGRIYTTPNGFVPTALIETGAGSRNIQLASCDAFEESIKMYLRAVDDDGLRADMAQELVRQAEFVDAVRKNEG